jgi:hypothetical protein
LKEQRGCTGYETNATAGYETNATASNITNTSIQEVDAPPDFDCKAGVENWVNGWSDLKVSFCCEKEGYPCSAEQALAPGDTGPPSGNETASGGADLVEKAQVGSTSQLPSADGVRAGTTLVGVSLLTVALTGAALLRRRARAASASAADAASASADDAEFLLIDSREQCIYAGESECHRYL